MYLIFTVNNKIRLEIKTKQTTTVVSSVSNFVK